MTNVTFPTGVVTSLHGDMSSGAVAVDIETSGRDEDVAITTNLSSIDSFYTLVQGKKLMQPEKERQFPETLFILQVASCVRSILKGLVQAELIIWSLFTSLSLKISAWFIVN